MVLNRFLLIPSIVAVVALSALPAAAKTTVIAELGTAPLLGSSSSTAQMQARVAGNATFVAQAVRKLGLSRSEYEQFSSAIAGSRVAWVTVPRHLDAMTWRSGSSVYVLHDVKIPAGTHGWEVDLHSSDHELALYMPAACGNVSLVRRPVRVIAKRPVAPPVVAVAPPVVTPVAGPVVIPDDTPAAPPVTVAQAEFPPAPVVVHHSALFLAPLLAGIAALSGGIGGGPISTVPVGCP